MAAKIANKTVLVSQGTKEQIKLYAFEMTLESGRQVKQAEVVERAIEALRRERQET